MRRLIFVGLLLFCACTIEEEAVGDLPYTIEESFEILSVGGSAAVAIGSPEIERLELEYDTPEGIEISQRRVDETLQLELSAEEAQLGDTTIDLTMTAGARQAVHTLEFAVVEAALDVQPQAVTVELGEEVNFDLNPDVQGVPFDIAVNADKLIGTKLTKNQLTLKGLGLCEACPVTINVIAEGEVLAQETVTVDVTLPRTLALNLDPATYTVATGETFGIQIRIERGGFDGAVSLEAQTPNGITAVVESQSQDTGELALITVDSDLEAGTYQIEFIGTGLNVDVTTTQTLSLDVSN